MTCDLANLHFSFLNKMANKIFLSDKELALMCPSLAPSRRAQILEHYNEAMDRFGINTSIFRVAAFFSNLMHESCSFKFMKEIWGNTPAQKRYDIREDLGNTPERDGDGKFYMGRGGIQRTGKANYRRAQDVLHLPLLAQPQLLEKVEYAALSDCLFWSDASLNRLADCLTGKRDANEEKILKAICKRINGGYNGLQERIKLYWRCLAILQRHSFTAQVTKELNGNIIANPAIPEIQNPIAASRISKKELTPASESAVVAEQEKASRMIDYAEAVAPSQARAVATNVWAKTGGRVVSGFAWFYALLQAGSFGAWAVLIVAIIGLLYLIVSQRATFKRWYALAVLHVKDFFTIKEETA